MRPRSSTDTQWLEWIEVQKAATHSWISDDLPKAIALIDEFITTQPPQDLERQAIGFRGSIRQEQGDLNAAKADYLAALELSEGPDFERYTLEESAAAVSEQLGQKEEAELLCIQALKTAVADPRVSGAGTLVRLLRLREKVGLSKEELQLAEQLVRQSWVLLRVEGEPDIKDLHSTAKRLIEAQRGPFSAENPPAPPVVP